MSDIEIRLNDRLKLLVCGMLTRWLVCARPSLADGSPIGLSARQVKIILCRGSIPHSSSVILSCSMSKQSINRLLNRSTNRYEAPVQVNISAAHNLIMSAMDFDRSEMEVYFKPDTFVY